MAVRRMGFAGVVALSAVIILAGCSKKVVKAPEPVVEPPKPEVVVPPPPPPPPPPPTVDTNALIREKLTLVYFDYDQSTVRSDAVSKLDVAGPFLKEYSTIKFTLEGNCDERGSSEYNIGLGEKRAKAVREWLVNYGIPVNRIETTSYGKERPVAAGCADDDDGCHQQNRRVEFRVTGK